MVFPNIQGGKKTSYKKTGRKQLQERKKPSKQFLQQVPG